MRRLSIAVAATLLVLATVAPVSASSISFHRSDYHQFDFSWIQLDRNANGDRLEPTPNRPFGNTHIGSVWAYEVAPGMVEVFGDIADLDCPTDYVPPYGGGHGFADEEEPGPCTHIGVRGIQGVVPFTVGSKLSTARLGGNGITIGIYGGGDPHGGGGELLANVPMNVVFTGVGATSKSTYTERWTDGTFTYSDRYNSERRAATLSGVLGPMGFDPDLSGGSFSYNRQMSHSRSR